LIHGGVGSRTSKKKTRGGKKEKKRRGALLTTQRLGGDDFGKKEARGKKERQNQFSRVMKKEKGAPGFQIQNVTIQSKWSQKTKWYTKKKVLRVYHQRGGGTEKLLVKKGNTNIPGGMSGILHKRNNKNQPSGKKNSKWGEREKKGSKLAKKIEGR